MVIRVRGIEIRPETRTILYGGHTSRFYGGKNYNAKWAMMVSLICGGGLTSAQLIEIMWSYDPNGGPDNPYMHVQVYLSQIRKWCAKLGLKITAERRGVTQNSYEIVPVAGEPSP